MAAPMAKLRVPGLRSATGLLQYVNHIKYVANPSTPTIANQLNAPKTLRAQRLSFRNLAPAMTATTPAASRRTAQRVSAAPYSAGPTNRTERGISSPGQRRNTPTAIQNHPMVSTGPGTLLQLSFISAPPISSAIIDRACTRSVPRYRPMQAQMQAWYTASQCLGHITNPRYLPNLSMHFSYSSSAICLQRTLHQPGTRALGLAALWKLPQEHWRAAGIARQQASQQYSEPPSPSLEQ